MASPTSPKSVAAESAYQSRLSAMSGGPIAQQTQAIQSSGPSVQKNADGSTYMHNYVSTNPADSIAGSRPGMRLQPDGVTPTGPTVGPTTPIAPKVGDTIPGSNLKYEEADIANLQGEIPNTQLAQSQQAALTLQKNAQGVYTATPNLSQQYQQAHQALNQSGVNPVTGGQGSAAVQTALQGSGVQQEPPSIAGALQAEDSNFDSIFTEYDEFFSPKVQRTSLLDEYNKLSGSLGIDKMNQELIDSKRIIEGTESDIRDEITSTGGLATDSQVLALANARNKSLIKNYNYLLDAKNAASTQLTTMMSLSVQDRQFAEAEIDRKLNFGFQVAQFKERATQNAKTGLQWAITNGAGAEILKNPYETSLVEKTLGLPSGGLAGIVAKQSEAETQVVKLDNGKTVLVNSKTGAIIKDLGGQKPGGGGEAPTVKTINGVDMQWNPAKSKWEPITTEGGGGVLRTAQAEQDIQLVESLITDKNIRTAVGPTGLARFIGKGFDTATGGRQNFIAGVEQLRSQLSLDSLIDAKARGATFGALSEGELKVLSASAS